MKVKFCPNLLIIIFLSLFMMACQEEETDTITADNQETIAANSDLAQLMKSATANDGSIDDFLDESSCFSVSLPVTITIGNTVITINSEEDLHELETFVESFNEDDYDIEFTFPISIVFGDFSEIVIENEEALAIFVEDCIDSNEEEDIIECIDFQYPISFSVFDTSFQIIDTVTIEDDEGLYVFLNSLEDDNEALVVSLDYPVTLVYADGNTIEVNSNEELVNAIDAAEEDCNDSEDACNAEDVQQALVECVWELDYDNTELQFVFNENGAVMINEGIATSAVGGNWILTTTDDGLILTFSELTGYQDDFGGGWLVVECDDDRIKLVRGDEVLVFEQNCNYQEAQCDWSQMQVANYLIECLHKPTLNGHTPIQTTFNFKEDNTLSILYEGDLLFSGTWDIATIDNQITVFITVPGLEAYSQQWHIGSCEEEGLLVLISGQDELIFERDCGVNNPFQCFQDIDGDYEICDNDGDGIAVIDLTQYYSNCTGNSNVIVSYHVTQADAETAVGPIASPQVFTNYANPQTIYVRVEANNGTYEVFNFDVIVENCTSGCDDEDIMFNLMECEWNIVNYNGSDNLLVYDLDFETEEVLMITNTSSNEPFTALWDVSGSTIVFSNVAAPNIQAINGLWEVVECGVDRLELHRDNDIMILERDCN